MKIKPLKTEEEYKEALREIDGLFDAAPNTDEGDKLEVLAILVEDYEKKYHNIPLPDPIDALEYYLESHGLPQNALVPFIGTRSRVSEILNRKRRLTLDMIQSLERGTGIPANILIKPYELAGGTKFIDDYIVKTSGAASGVYFIAGNRESMNLSPESENGTVEYKFPNPASGRKTYRNTQPVDGQYLQ
jgi:HTH-type transcriptional regulator/antitoxin HigA